MRVLVTGSRTWTDTSIIRDALAEVWHPRNVLVHPACRTGADALADACWRYWGGRVERHPAETVYQPCRDDCRHGPRRRDQRGRYYCPTPPQRRNRLMVASGVDICLAFIQSKSSAATETARLARQAGIPVRLYRTGLHADFLARPPAVRRDTDSCAQQLALPLATLRRPASRSLNGSPVHL